MSVRNAVLSGLALVVMVLATVAGARYALSVSPHVAHEIVPACTWSQVTFCRVQ